MFKLSVSGNKKFFGGTNPFVASRTVVLDLTLPLLELLVRGAVRVGEGQMEITGNIYISDFKHNPPVFQVHACMREDSKKYIEKLRTDGWVFNEVALAKYKWQ